MHRARRLASATVLALSIVAAGMLPLQAQARPMDQNDQPSALAMFGDAVIVRPVMTVATVFGTALFTVTLPFTALGGNVDQAADTLVKTPAKTAFLRCLGCTPQQDERRRMDEKAERARGDQNRGMSGEDNEDDNN